MNIVRAATYALPIRNRSTLRSFGKIWLLSPIPIFGQFWAMGYANLTLRRMLQGHVDDPLPRANADWSLFLRGLGVAVLTLLVEIAVAFLFAPLFLLEAAPEASDSVDTTLRPALVQALTGPSELLVTAIAAVLVAVVITRYALTNSFTAALNPFAAWTHLRAEPAIWIAAAVVGFLTTNGAAAIAWALPLKGGWADAATIGSTYFWTLGLMVNTHVLAQAFAWSKRTSAKRAATMGYRW